MWTWLWPRCVSVYSELFTKLLVLLRRDGSASMSVMSGNEAVLQYQHPPPDDTAAFEFRAEQLKHRRQEVSATVDLLTGVAEYDHPSSDAGKNIWNEKSGREGADRQDLVNDPLKLLRARVVRDKVTIIGHSFGAATSFLASQQDQRLSGLVALDPWMFPLPADFCVKLQHRALPMLIINSSAFHWPANLQSLKQVLERNRELVNNDSVPSIQVSIADSRHMDQSDVAIITPRWLAARMGGEPLSDPVETLSINTQLIGAFMDGLVSEKDSRQPVIGPSFGEMHQYKEMIWNQTVHSSPNSRVTIDIKL